MEIDDKKLHAFIEKTVGELGAAFNAALVLIGDKLGLYKAMAGAGPLSSQELAKRSGCAERYVREWLNAQAAGGYVSYHAKSGTYELMPEQARRMDKLAVIRSVNHGTGDHTKANHWMLTGFEGPTFNAPDNRIQRRPSMGSAVARLVEAQRAAKIHHLEHVETQIAQVVVHGSRQLLR